MPRTKGGPDGTRAKLRTAALEVVDERGYGDAPASEIARRAGLTTGAIYSNYANKDELLADAALSTMSDPALVLSQFGIDLDSPDFSLAAALEQLIFGDPMVSPELVLDIAAHAARNEHVRARMQTVATSGRSAIAVVLETGRGNGQVDAALEIGAIVYLIEIITLGLMTSRALDLPRPTDEELRPVLHRMAASMRPPPTRGQPEEP